MKTSLQTFALTALSLGLLALPPSVDATSNFDNCILFEEGRLVLLRHGRTRPLDRPLTLSDGTFVRLDGYYRKAGGYWTPLGEGDTMAMDGLVMNVSTLTRKLRRR